MGFIMKNGQVLLFGLLVALVPFAAHGQDAKMLPKASPVGIGADWNANVTPAPTVSGNTITTAQIATVAKVNGYFNNITDLRGVFKQTAADDRKARGKFFVKRPGRFKFVYSPPSKLVILSDGERLLIEDHDLKTVDRFPIESTPFRLLLKRDVDLLRDAHVTLIQETDEKIAISLSDKKPNSSGKIQLYFKMQPEMVLSEWIITDAQGLDTRISIAKLNKEESIDKRVFVGSKIDMPNFGGE